MISIIVAVTKNRMIGKDNDFPWHLSADLRRFKALTTGHSIIMGRGNYDHLMQRIGKMLPDRESIVVTNNTEFADPNVTVVHSLEQALVAANAKEKEVFVIGGGQIFALALPYADKIYMTQVDVTLDGDTFFPELDMKEWQKVSSEKHTKDEKNDYDYEFIELKRK